MSVFVHAQGIKTVHVVVECPLKRNMEMWKNVNML